MRTNNNDINKIETEFMIMAFVLQLAIDRSKPDCTKLLAAQCNYH